MKNIKKSFIILTVLFLLLACQNKKSKEIETILVEMQGKKIYFPSTLRSVLMGKDTLCPSIFEKENRIVVYFDSVGCTECQMRLRDWSRIIEYSRDSLTNLSLIFVISPKKGESRKTISMLDKYDIKHPFFIDSLNQFGKLNKLPKEHKFHTFLIDSKNRIVLVGSPIDSKNLWQLYKDYVTKRIKNTDAVVANNSELNPKEKKKTQIQVLRDSINLSKFSYQSIKQALFQIKNHGNQPLIIQTVNTSCGCTVAKYDMKPIKPGEIAIVKLEYKPNSVGYFYKNADVVCNVSKGFVRLTITGEVLKK